MSLLLVLAAAAVCGSSGIPALLSGRTSNGGQILAAILSAAGSALGLAGVALYLAGDAEPAINRSWDLPGGSFFVALDGLTALFLLPVFIISALGAIYGLGYWRQSENPGNGRKLRAFYGLLAGSMTLLLVARSSVLFLMAWEAMALSAYFLVATDDREASARRAAWIYLVATHLGTMALLALFALMRNATGSFDWAPIAAAAGASWIPSVIFLLALLGFGLKAGIMPLHVWLPSAHASAPSHVSGLLSGVMIKMGIYGILRIAGYLGPPPLWWGLLLLALGMASGIVGVAAAVGQRDLKRMLAYSSIENIGIITAGIGLASMGRSLGEESWVALGLGGALFHTLNHGLFKPLLFFSAGSVIHAAGTRRIDALGGLGRAMPITFLGFTAGAWAICGLPVFNGFLSEFLLYRGLFQAAISGSGAIALLAALAVAALALVGGLALACFVRAGGAIFLGSGRTERTEHAHEAPLTMKLPILLLAGLCFTLGVAPACAAPIIDRALAGAAGGIGTHPRILEASALPQACLLALGLLALIGAGAFLLRWRSISPPADSRTSPEASVGTWDCGYADPSSPRLQYTSSSSSDMLAGLFRWAVRIEEVLPRPEGPFPAPSGYRSEATEPLLDRALNPFFQRWADRFARLRVLQRGNLQIYLIYILVTLVAVIAWGMLSPGSGP